MVAHACNPIREAEAEDQDGQSLAIIKSETSLSYMKSYLKANI